MSKLLYKKKKGLRIKKRFYSVTIGGNIGLWFSCKDNKIKTIEECRKDGEGYSSHSNKPIRSIKAFRRFIKNNINDIPIGASFILLNTWVGYDVIYIKFK